MITMYRDAMYCLDLLGGYVTSRNPLVITGLDERSEDIYDLFLKDIVEKEAPKVANISQIIVKYEKRFRMTFGQDLRAFIHPVLGFDIIEFDAYIETPDGTSTREHIRAKYGDATVDMVYEILMAVPQ